MALCPTRMVLTMRICTRVEMSRKPWLKNRFTCTTILQSIVSGVRYLLGIHTAIVFLHVFGHVRILPMLIILTLHNANDNGSWMHHIYSFKNGSCLYDNVFSELLYLMYPSLHFIDSAPKLSDTSFKRGQFVHLYCYLHYFSLLFCIAYSCGFL